MKLSHTYAIFCDDNDLPRIDATPEDELSNLDKMATALLRARVEALAVIAARCEHCAGTGKKIRR